MLVRDVLPLLADGTVVVVDQMDNELWRGLKSDVPGEKGVLPLNVLLVDYDILENEFVVVAGNRSDDFHEIELLLSECLRYADEGRMVSYVAIMHLARRVAQIAETNFARMIGRWVS